jgi:signal transduction histidine kinase
MKCTHLKKWIYLILFAALVPSVIRAQQDGVDSLLNALDRTTSADGQAAIYRELFRRCMAFDVEKAIMYTRRGLAVAEKEKNRAMASVFNERLGIAYTLKASHDTARACLEKALEQAVEAGDREQESSVCTSMGNFHARQSNYTPALEFYMRSLDIDERRGDKRNCIVVLTNIGAIHHTMVNFSRAIHFYEQAESLAEELGDSGGIMSEIYYALVSVYFDRKQFDKALEYALKVTDLSRDTGDYSYEAAGKQALARIYSEGFKAFDKAMQYADELMQLAGEHDDPRLSAMAWDVMANIYCEQGLYRECEEAALRAREIDSTNLEFGYNTATHLTISNIYLGNKDRAATFFGNYVDIMNRYADKNSQEALINMEIRYETEKKEMRIHALEREKRLFAGLFIAFVVIALLSVMIMINNRRLQERNRQLIVSRAVIDGEVAEQTRIAHDLHDGLGGFLSAVGSNLADIVTFPRMDESDIHCLHVAKEMLDTSVRELRLIAHHLMPDALKCSGLKVAVGDFCRALPNVRFAGYGSEERVEELLEIQIYRCAHELINNAVKHAGAERIEVQLMLDRESVLLTVSDNGKGFDPDAAARGAGLKNIRNRVAFVKGDIRIDSSPGEGTEVIIHVKRK